MDAIAEIIEQLSPRVQGWRYMFGGESGLEKPEVDDSSWELVNVGHRWEGENTNVWYRRTIIVPEKLSGFPIAGEPLRLRLTVDDDGEVFVNGERVQSFHWDQGNAVITRAARPGEKIHIALLGKNRGGPGRLLEARLEADAVSDILARIREHNASVYSAQVMVEAVGERRWQEVISRAGGLVDLSAAASGDRERLVRSMEAAQNALAPLEPLLKQFEIALLGNAHIDLAWLWPWRETVQVCHDTFSSALDLMEKFPGFVYAQSQAQAYKWMEEYHPQIFEAIHKRVKEGRWEIVGGMWAETDANIPNGESFARQLLYGKRYFMHKFGVEPTVGWLPDTFGFNWNLPQILKKAGCPYFLTTKINWNDTTRFPHVVFWWQAPDGSRVLAYQPVAGYGESVEREALARMLSQHFKRTGLKDVLVLYGRGDHGGGPNPAELEEAKALQANPCYPGVALGSALDWFTKQEKVADLPVWDSELYLEYHRGTYTSQAKTKRNNRQSEILMNAAELFCSWAHLAGLDDYPLESLNAAWEKILMNQFHDILPGSSIPQVYVDSRVDYDQVFSLAQNALQSSLEALAQRIDTSDAGEHALVLFNPLSWDRTDLVEAEVPAEVVPDVDSLCAADANGSHTPVQVIGRSGERVRILFVAESVPAMGYKWYRLERCTSTDHARGIPLASEAGMENDYFQVAFDPRTGACSHIYDKKRKREVLDGKGHGFELQAFGDDGNNWDIHLNFRDMPIALDKGARMEVVETGPVRTVVRVTRKLGPSTLHQDYILYRNLGRIDCAFDVNWHSKHTLLKCAFPLSVRAAKATYEIPYAVIERSTGEETPEEAAKFEACAQRWVDVSGGGYGVSLLNNPKYGHDIKGNLMRITLLRGPTDPDPECDMGEHRFSIALYPHAGDWRQAQTVRRGYEFNYPMLAVVEPAHRGQLPAEMSLFRVEPESIVLSAVKKAEDSDELVLRWYEIDGKRTTASITLPKEAKAACETDLLEREIGPANLSRKTLSLETGPYEIKTVRVRF
jgi:alpha-mannosidase